MLSTSRNPKRFREAFVLAFALVFMHVAPSFACLEPPGDVTQDETTNVVDVMCVALTSLWQLSGSNEAPPDCVEVSLSKVDLNCDQAITVTDLVMSIQLSLALPLNVVVDADGDLCADACTIKTPAIVTGTFGGGSIRGAHDGSFTLDGQLGARQIHGNASDGILQLRTGVPKGGAP